MRTLHSHFHFNSGVKFTNKRLSSLENKTKLGERTRGEDGDYAADGNEEK